MSQGDSFIGEVAEEVRRDRMFRLWRRYGAYVIVAIFVVVAGAAANAWLTRNAEERARQQMEEVLAAIDEDDAEETAKALDEILGDLDGGYQVLARFRAAAAHLEGGDHERAGELYREIAAREDLQPWFIELAGLKAVLAESEEMQPADLVTALRPHALEGRIYRVVAQEMLAGALVAAGEYDEALELIEEVLDNPDLGGSAQRRLGDLRDAAEARFVIPAEDDPPDDEDSDADVADDETTTMSGEVDAETTAEDDGSGVMAEDSDSSEDTMMDAESTAETTAGDDGSGAMADDADSSEDTMMDAESTAEDVEGTEPASEAAPSDGEVTESTEESGAIVEEAELMNPDNEDSEAADTDESPPSE